MVHPTHSRTNSSVPTLPALIPIPTPSAHPPIHPPRTATPPAAQIHKGRLACVFSEWRRNSLSNRIGNALCQNHPIGVIIITSTHNRRPIHTPIHTYEPGWSLR